MHAPIVNGPESTQAAARPDAAFRAPTDATIVGTRQARFERGMEVLSSIDAEAGQKVIDPLADVSPELGHQAVAWAYGDIYTRPLLCPRERQLITLGMLTALGGCEPQLEFHLNAAPNVGLAPEEIVEALLHSAVYCGIPKALNATFVAKKVFADRDLLPIAINAGLGDRSSQ
jgi:4-carboxymuconolactone decarboxylase